MRARDPDLPGARSGILRRGPVQVEPMPKLEDEQQPEAKRVIAPAGDVFLDDPRDEAAVEVAARSRRR